MAAKLIHAGCEMATKKSNILSNSVSVRAKLQMRLAPLGVEANDFASGTGVSTAVRRARLETSKGRVERIRKIHGRSSVPWRRRLAQTAHASLSKANHNGVVVTGLNETQLQQSRSQVASCLAKRMHDKSVTMVLMTAGNVLDPVFDSLVPVIALTHALWDGWMPVATLAKCVKTAQIEQRDSARTLAAVKGATVKRMQRMILQKRSIPVVHAPQPHRGPEKGLPTQHAHSTQQGGAGVANGDATRCMRAMKALTVELS